MSISSGVRRQQKLAKERNKAKQDAAEKQRRSLTVPTIFLDESGNTGAKAVLLLAGHPLAVSPADLSEMLPVLIGMLGIGTLRTVERLNGAIPAGR